MSWQTYNMLLLIKKKQSTETKQQTIFFYYRPLKPSRDKTCLHKKSDSLGNFYRKPPVSLKITTEKKQKYDIFSSYAPCAVIMVQIILQLLLLGFGTLEKNQRLNCIIKMSWPAFFSRAYLIGLLIFICLFVSVGLDMQRIYKKMPLISLLQVIMSLKLY